MKKVFYLIYLIVGLLMVINYLQAAGLSVTPDKLFIQVKNKDQASQDLYIENITNQPTLYNLYSDELADQIVIQPNFFRLEAGESQKVKVIVKPRQTGIYVTNLSVVAQSLDRREFNAATGVKIPLEIVVQAAPKSFLEIWPWGIVGVVFLLVVWLVIMIIKHKKKRSLWSKIGHSINLLHHHKPWWRRLIK